LPKVQRKKGISAGPASGLTYTASPGKELRKLDDSGIEKSGSSCEPEFHQAFVKRSDLPYDPIDAVEPSQ
jgi:hypothetical protein